MSTDLYGVRVLSVDRAKRRVSFTVFVVYYEVSGESHQPLLDEPSFFCRLLSEPYDAGAALQDEDRLLDEDYVDSNAWRYVESVKRLATRNEPITDWSGFSDFYYERDGGWQDEDKLVQADFEVVFTDAKWMAHFQTGQSWGTTSYPTRADMPGTAASVLPDLRREVRRIEPFVGEREQGTPDDVMFTSDGKLLAITSEGGGVVVYDTSTWAETMRAKIETTWGQAELFPNSHVLAMRDGDKGAVSGWDAGTGTPVAIELPPGLARSPSGMFRGFFGVDPGLQLYDEHGTALHVIAPEQHIERVAFHPDDETIATVGMEPEITFWRISDGSKLRTFTPEAERIMHLSFSPDGKWLVVSDGDLVAILDAQTGAVMRRSKKRGGIPVEVAWSDKYVASLWVGDMGYGGYVALFEIGAPETAAEMVVMKAPASKPRRKKKQPIAKKRAAAKKPAKKQPAKKQPAKKQPTKKRPTKKQPAKKNPRTKPPARRR